MKRMLMVLYKLIKEVKSTLLLCYCALKYRVTMAIHRLSLKCSFK